MRNVLRNVSTLTIPACERLKRGSLGDPTHPGLRIMARPSGAKVWIYRFRDPAGKMAQLLIGSFPALSLADARRMNRLDLGAKTWTHTQGNTGDVSVTPFAPHHPHRPGSPGLPVRDRRIHPGSPAARCGRRLLRPCLRRRDAQVAGPVGGGCGGNRRAARQTRARKTLPGLILWFDRHADRKGVSDRKTFYQS